jgi:hypothetical protein
METNNNTFNTELNQEMNTEMNENTSGNSRARLAAIGGAVLASAAGGAGVAYALNNIGLQSAEPEEPTEPETPETPTEVKVVVKEQVKIEEKNNEEPEPEREDFITINNLKVVDMGHTEINGEMVAYAVVQEPVTEQYYYMYDIDHDEVFDVIANEEGEYAFFDQTNPLETISYADAFDHIDDQELMARLIAEGETPTDDIIVLDDGVAEMPVEADNVVDTLDVKENEELLASNDEQPEELWPVDENDSVIADNQPSESWPEEEEQASESWPEESWPVEEEQASESWPTDDPVDDVIA